jgi:hypothetical protein
MTFFLGFVDFFASAFNRSMCSLACFKTFGWKTASANSGLVISEACFGVFFFAMVIL